MEIPLRDPVLRFHRCDLRVARANFLLHDDVEPGTQRIDKWCHAEDRLCDYEVATTFTSDQQSHGNHWSSGQRIFYLDAETGRVIAIQTIGKMTINEGMVRPYGVRCGTR